MHAVATLAALVVLMQASAPAAARGGGLGTWTCLDRPGIGGLASDGSACRNWVNPYESAASATARVNAAWLKRYPNEATLEAMRAQVLERMRERTPAAEQEAAAAKVNRVFDAQLKRMRSIWPPEP